MKFRFPSFSVSISRVLRNFAANILGQAMNGFYQIAALPLFLHYWNSQLLGEWFVLFSIPSILWSMEGGLSAVAVNRMTVAGAKGDWELVNSIFQNVFFVQGLLSIFIMAASAFVLPLVNLQIYFHFKQTTNHDAYIILLILLAYMLTGFYLSLFRAIYRAAEVEHRGAMATNFYRLSDFCISVVVLVCHGHMLVLAKAILLNAIVWAFLLFFDTKRICPKIEYGIRRASWAQSKSAFVDGLPLLAGQAAMALFLQGYPLIINRVLGASAVVAFVSIRTVSRIVLLLNQVICLSSAPEVSRSYGRQDREGYTRLLKIMLASAMFAGLVTLVGLTTIGPWAISLWTSGKVVVGHATLFLFAISIALQGICAVGSIVLVCSNVHHLYNYLYLAATLCALAVANFALPILGFIGVPATMVVQDVVNTIMVFSLCRSKLDHISFRDFRSMFSARFYLRKARFAYDVLTTKTTAPGDAL